jgi:hypothetical protein
VCLHLEILDEGVLFSTGYFTAYRLETSERLLEQTRSRTVVDVDRPNPRVLRTVR